MHHIPWGVTVGNVVVHNQSYQTEIFEQIIKDGHFLSDIRKKDTSTCPWDNFFFYFLCFFTGFYG